MTQQTNRSKGPETEPASVTVEPHGTSSPVADEAIVEGAHAPVPDAQEPGADARSADAPTNPEKPATGPSVGKTRTEKRAADERRLSAKKSATPRWNNRDTKSQRNIGRNIGRSSGRGR